MLTQFRLAAAAAAVLGAAWASAAFADWPFSAVARLEPGYGGVCEECDLSGRILVGARMTNSVFNRTNFSHAMMSRADASGSAFEDADFTLADLSNTKLIAARCAGADFEQAILRNSDASRADFTRADLRGASLENGAFVRTNFAHARLHRARLAGADFSGADLSSVRGLTQAQLAESCGDRATRLPRGLRVAMCR